MNWKMKAGIALLLAASALSAMLILQAVRSHAAFTVTLRIAVQPPEQAGFVLAQANSAKFKYLAGKQAGVKPVLAQKLVLKRMPNAPLIEAKVAVLSKDEGRRYAEGFVETLQMLCGAQAQIALADQSVH